MEKAIEYVQDLEFVKADPMAALERSVRGQVIARLNTAAAHLADAERDLGHAKAALDACTAMVTIHALGRALFTNKNGELVQASNDTERKAAIDYALSTDGDYVSLKAKYDMAVEAYNARRNQLEADKALAKLLSVA